MRRRPNLHAHEVTADGLAVARAATALRDQLALGIGMLAPTAPAATALLLTAFGAVRLLRVARSLLLVLLATALAAAATATPPPLSAAA